MIQIQWQQGSRQICISNHDYTLSAPIYQAMGWDKENLVVVVLEKVAGLQWLLLLDADGHETCRIAPPRDYDFYYLESSAIYGVTVICSTDQPVPHYSDWRFSIIPEKCELFKVGPSK